jgi:tocopherol O-methyltransferase
MIDSHARAVADHYDELDAFYRELWGEHLHHGLWLYGGQSVDVAVRQLVALVACRAAVVPGSRVCDAGSGYGATARLLARRGADVTAVTISPRQHAFACATSQPEKRPTYVLGDWLKEPLPEARFDSVIAIESTEHMADQAAFFRKAARLVRPGGRVVVCAWLARPNAGPRERRLLLEPIRRDGRLTALAPSTDYLHWIESAGLELVGYEDLSPRVRPTWSICLRRVLLAIATDTRYRRYLLDRAMRDRAFLLAVPRIWLAYHTGTMRYGLFTTRRPVEASIV